MACRFCREMQVMENAIREKVKSMPGIGPNFEFVRVNGREFPNIIAEAELKVADLPAYVFIRDAAKFYEKFKEGQLDITLRGAEQVDLATLERELETRVEKLIGGIPLRISRISE